MTDLTIPQTIRPLIYRRPVPIWRTDLTASQRLGVDVSGSLSGTIKEMGVLQPNAVFALYYRANGRLIVKLRADANGAWSVSGLDKTTSNYFVVVFSENAVNALVYDKLIPA